jgi:NADH:ubiquinone oxidoreductase subunit F (NADH-binding)
MGAPLRHARIAFALRTRATFAMSSTQQGGMLPRLLAGVSSRAAMTLDRHHSVHGANPALGAKRRGGGAQALVHEVEMAGLLGRGGAAFPMATKLRAVANASGKAVVVVNGAEGEPASLKDKTLLSSSPHLVLDGSALAAAATGADEVLVCVCELTPDVALSVKRALDERSALAGEPPQTTVVSVPGDYVAGQESALVHYLNRGPAKPTFGQPVFERGVNRRPTLVSNPETLAHMALIARHGADWYRELGTDADPGSTLVTLLGPVTHPGVYEIERGASIPSLIEAAGGAAGELRAALIGGYAGTWVDGQELWNLSLCDDELAAHGAALAAGVIFLLTPDACPVAEVVHVARWLADQSAHQCGPCMHGLDALAGALEEVASGSAPGRGFHRVDRLLDLVRRRGACSHPDGTAAFVQSAVEVFAAEFEWHAEHGPCRRCKQTRELPVTVRSRAAHAFDEEGLVARIGRRAKAASAGARA